MTNSPTTIRHQDLFPTRLWFLELPNHADQCVSLIKYIEEWREKFPEGVNKSNRGGWQSESTLFSQTGFQSLAETLSQIVRFCLNEMSPGFKFSYSMNAWANINLPGSYNSPHIHAPALLSVVYYLKVPENSGAIYFRDPRAGAVLSGFRGAKNNCPPNCSADAKIMPREGLVLVFPAWLEHGVEDHHGIGTRISIAANAILTN